MNHETQKRLIGAGLTLAAAVLLTACGKTASDAKTYSSTFGADPTTFNYILDYSGDNTNVITNLVDGLLENDNYGNLIPALAEDWSVSKDGLTYTYKLRQDANGSRLMGRNMRLSKHKISSQVSSMQLITESSSRFDSELN